VHVAFVNPQGNFDPQDSYWTEHPDFGGQLVYVKEVALAMAARGHKVDILTRRVVDADWPEFEAPLDSYPGVEGVRIVRLPCGPDRFLPKEELWPYLGSEWVPNILDFYRREGNLPEALTTHYADGGLAGALLAKETGAPFTFTAHSLGAQKMDKLGVTPENLAEIDARYHFARRILAERVSMSHAGRIIISTRQERMEQYAHPAYRGAVYPSDDRKFVLIPPGVNRRVFSPEPKPEDSLVRKHIRAALERDIAEGRRELPLIVYSGRLDRKKNVMGLVRAFAQSQAVQTLVNLGIVVRGLEDPLRDYDSLSASEGEIMDEMVSVLNTRDLWGKVTALPINSQDELAAAYRILTESRSVFALTSRYEPFGLAPLEAMAVGLPAVVTRNGGPAETLREGDQEYGVLVDPFDPADIARGLLRVLGNEASWRRYAEAGRRRVHDRYTWEGTARQFEQILGEVTHDPPRPDGLPIPPYFLQPTPENDISLEELAELYFKGEGVS
jgi:sucrose-phosphate synthase